MLLLFRVAVCAVAHMTLFAALTVWWPFHLTLFFAYFS
jgi:hypothetical protein